MAGLKNATNVTLDQLNNLANSSTLPEFYVKINTLVYGGVLWFTILCVLWTILFLGMQRRTDKFLNNLMYSGAVVSVLALLLRGVGVVLAGSFTPLIEDKLMWIFPIITIILAAVLWATKE